MGGAEHAGLVLVRVEGEGANVEPGLGREERVSTDCYGADDGKGGGTGQDLKGKMEGYYTHRHDHPAVRLHGCMSDYHHQLAVALTDTGCSGLHAQGKCQIAGESEEQVT